MASGETPMDPMSLPPDLPAPEDDGAASHLPGTRLPGIALPATTGGAIDPSSVTGWAVVFAYPLTGRPGGELPGGEAGWNAIPGARGCTPELCGVRDRLGPLEARGATVFGLSTQTTDHQREVAERLGLGYPLLSDSELRLTDALRLPTFEVEGLTLLKRITLLVRDGQIATVAYPVFPPDGAAAQALELLAAQG
ncbi:MAG: peroxiredoxin [Thermoleophilaceae bacterium]|nr:peroxiredoxin [Thermoleophilaceae bacterium]